MTNLTDQETAISLAVLKSEFAHMKATLDDVKYANQRQSDQIDKILQAMNEARGGWRTLLMIGGAAGTVGGFVTWAVSHWR
jgi:hypothetical protein